LLWLAVVCCTLRLADVCRCYQMYPDVWLIRLDYFTALLDVGRFGFRVNFLQFFELALVQVS